MLKRIQNPNKEPISRMLNRLLTPGNSAALPSGTEVGPAWSKGREGTSLKEEGEDG